MKKITPILHKLVSMIQRIKDNSGAMSPEQRTQLLEDIRTTRLDLEEFNQRRNQCVEIPAADAMRDMDYEDYGRVG